MRLVLLVFVLIHNSQSTVDSLYQVQPQPIRINDLDEIYITSDDHYIGQVLYRSDSIQLACECQRQSNQTQSNIYWTVNNKILHRYNNLNSIQLVIDSKSVQVPITYVTCHCVFTQANSRKIKKDYQYQLYIDLESEPSLEPIRYTLQSSMIKQRFYHFFDHHCGVILSFALIILSITCPLIILNLVRFY